MRDRAHTFTKSKISKNASERHSRSPYGPKTSKSIFLEQKINSTDFVKVWSSRKGSNHRLPTEKGIFEIYWKLQDQSFQKIRNFFTRDLPFSTLIVIAFTASIRLSICKINNYEVSRLTEKKGYTKEAAFAVKPPMVIAVWERLRE